jgi:RNA polymerase sigma-70 factor (ECF subfamily)
MDRPFPMTTARAVVDTEHALPHQADAESLQDRQDLALANKGDDAAFRRLVERHQDRVAATVIGMLGPGNAAEDAAQETFIRLHGALGAFRQEARLSTYLTRIAINLALDKLRQRQRGLARFIGIEQDDFRNLEPWSDGAELLDERERARLVRKAVRGLGPSRRAVVVLRMLQGFSTDETAQALGIPRGTVMSRLSRGLKELKGVLAPLMSEGELP